MSDTVWAALIVLLGGGSVAGAVRQVVRWVKTDAAYDFLLAESAKKELRLAEFERQAPEAADRISAMERRVFVLEHDATRPMVSSPSRSHSALPFPLDRPRVNRRRRR